MTPTTGRTRILDPLERFSEIVFGLVMVLSFTCAMSVAEAGREDVRAMLIGALGCNLAWGVIDAAFYVISCLAERGRNITILREVRRAATPAAGQKLIAEALPSVVAEALEPANISSNCRNPPDGRGFPARIGAGHLGYFSSSSFPHCR
jgi:hypothetical protein